MPTGYRPRRASKCGAHRMRTVQPVLRPPGNIPRDILPPQAPPQRCRQQAQHHVRLRFDNRVCVFHADVPCTDPAYPNSATSSWTPTTATFAESEAPVPPQPQPLQQTNSGASSNGSAGNSSSMQPSLMRTSQLTATSTNYNPYSAGNSKAKLELQSDLNLMAVGWYVFAAANVALD